MRAAVLCDPGAPISIEDISIAAPRDNEVLVRIMATGICHSDFTVIRGKVPVALPLVPGHEAAGIVEAVGARCTSVQVGARVVLSWAPACGSCFYCARRHPTLCDSYAAAAGAGTLWDGTSRLGEDGAIRHYSCVSSFAERAIVPETACVQLPDHVSFEIGALVGCAVTTGFGAIVNDADVQRDDTVAVIGIGGVGVNALQAAVIRGARTVIAIDINPARAEQAETFGATHFVDAAAADAIERIRALTGGRGADHVVECTGQPSAMRLAYDAARPGGTVVIVGIARAGAELVVPATGFPGSKKRIVGSIYGGGLPAEDFARIFALYGEGRLLLDEQIGARIPLDRIEEALSWMEAGVAGRTIIRFDG